MKRHVSFCWLSAVSALVLVGAIVAFTLGLFGGDGVNQLIALQIGWICLVLHFGLRLWGGV